jgi:hypothetical protein
VGKRCKVVPSGQAQRLLLRLMSVPDELPYAFKLGRKRRPRYELTRDPAGAMDVLPPFMSSDLNLALYESLVDDDMDDGSGARQPQMTLPLHTMAWLTRALRG